MKNNVITTGKVISVRQLGTNFIINLSSSSSEIAIIIAIRTWIGFQKEFNSENVCLSGILTDEQTINANNISCFHNELEEDTYETRFEGKVKLVKKFDFNTPSKLYLKRLVFETENSVRFQAVALRKKATFFENIEEGSLLQLTAVYVSGDMPYWRIKNVQK